MRIALRDRLRPILTPALTTETGRACDKMKAIIRDSSRSGRTSVRHKLQALHTLWGKAFTNLGLRNIPVKLSPQGQEQVLF